MAIPNRGRGISDSRFSLRETGRNAGRDEGESASPGALPGEIRPSRGDAGEIDREATIPADDANLHAGAKIYSVHCAVCHGFPNQPPTAIAKGLFPRPPQLLPPKKGVTDDPVGETFWKVKNGIRLTGMPGFESSLSEPEMWQVSLFLLKADHLPSGVLESIR